jgi:hypothetical protein
MLFDICQDVLCQQDFTGFDVHVNLAYTTQHTVARHRQHNGHSPDNAISQYQSGILPPISTLTLEAT